MTDSRRRPFPEFDAVLIFIVYLPNKANCR
jgi:hypothetical protein